MKTKAKIALGAFIEKNRHGLLLLYFLIYLPWFGHLEKTVTTHFHVIHVALDDYIPFCEYFIIPYFLWFGYIAWGLGYFFLKNKDEYFRLCTVLFTGMTIFLVISTVYPNGHYLRPTTFAHNNIFVHPEQTLPLQGRNYASFGSRLVSARSSSPPPPTLPTAKCRCTSNS